MNTQKKYLTIILLLGLVGLALYVVTQQLVAHKVSDLRTLVESKISTQEETLKTLSELTARNAADEVTEDIVRDCSVSARSSFDSLLGRLDQRLSSAELQDLDSLFGRCGDFFAQRKAMMTSRLEREVALYAEYVNELEILDSVKNEKERVEGWRTLVAEERKQSELFMSLVAMQDEIIMVLLSGKPANSPEIEEILSRVSETQGLLIVTNKQAADLRTSLIQQ